jgi:hypothetical protein
MMPMCVVCSWCWLPIQAPRGFSSGCGSGVCSLWACCMVGYRKASLSALRHADHDFSRGLGWLGQMRMLCES